MNGVIFILGALEFNSYVRRNAGSVFCINVEEVCTVYGAICTVATLSALYSRESTKRIDQQLRSIEIRMADHAVVEDYNVHVDIFTSAHHACPHR